VRVDAERAGRYARAGLRWLRLLAPLPRRDGLRVFYGHDRIPAAGEPVAGGSAKFQRLESRFPNDPNGFTLLYLGSTFLPRDLGPLLGLAKRRSVPVVVNQDGVAYPGWAGDRTAELNDRYRRALTAAQHVIYQSEFSKRSADEFLGDPPDGWEILPNAVDVAHFTPAEHMPAGGPVLLLGGDQTQEYRLELGLRTFARVLETEPSARLLVTGRLVSSAETLVEELGLRDRVEFLGRYSQQEAPAIMQRAHLLLHTKVQDPCPSVVIEAMACGLPVVYPASGGTVELVDEEAGVGVPHPVGWERDQPPRAEDMAAAVLRVLGDRDRYSEAARRRAVERFDVGPWLDRHAELFHQLLANRQPR
jgi:glycosyltransferase involved in cell wall biosynthesis